MENEGLFIVLEGTDGAGKGTQVGLLADRLQKAGHTVATFDFPQYDSPSSFFIKRYLNGEYGTIDEVGPLAASLFYALDRFEAAPKIRQALEEGKIVLANRYAGSSMAHQGAKIASIEERRGFFIWLDNLEFEMLRLPRPSVSFVLRVPVDMAQSLVDRKGERSYTSKKRDLHEADLAHMQQAFDAYDDLCQLFPKDFQRIDCVRDGKLLEVETIHTLLWEKVNPLLPAPEIVPRPSAPSSADQSLQAGQSLTVENVSQLVAHKFGSRAQLSAPAKPVVYVPKDLGAEVTTKYQEAMGKLLSMRAQLLDELAKQQIGPLRAQAALESVLPAAMTSDAKLRRDDPGLKVMLGRLLSNDLPEARAVGEGLLEQLRSLEPQFEMDLPKVSSASTPAAIAAKELGSKHAAEEQGLQLAEVWPRNELDLVPDMLYEYSDLPVRVVREAVQSWPYERKQAAFEAYVKGYLDLRHSGQALSKARYTWDVMTDYRTYRQVQMQYPSLKVSLQHLTPRYGYSIPKVIEDSGLADKFEACFDLSLELYSLLQKTGHPQEAQYAVLLGHKLRWSLSCDGLQAAELLRQAHSAKNAVLRALNESLGQSHPILSQLIATAS